MKALALETEQEPTFTQRGLRVLKKRLIENGSVSADLVHEEIGEPASPAEWGSLFRHPAFRQIAERDGFTYSTKTGNPIHLWKLREDVNLEELEKEVQA